MKDPAFQAKLLERIRGSAQARPGTTQLPPSLNRVSGAAPAVVEDGDDNSDAGIFRYATR